MARQELAHYLRDRRAPLRPHEIGLTETGHRPTAHRGCATKRCRSSPTCRSTTARGWSRLGAPGRRPGFWTPWPARCGSVWPSAALLLRLAGSSAPPGTSTVRGCARTWPGCWTGLSETGAIVNDAAYHAFAWSPLARALLGAAPGDGTTALARYRFLSQGRIQMVALPAGPWTSNRRTPAPHPQGETNSGTVGAASAGPGRPRLHRLPARSAVSRVHDVCPHLVEMSVCGVKPGRVLADDRRLAGHEPHTDRTPSGRPGNGALTTPDQEGHRADTPQRSRVAICINSVYRPACRHRRLRPRRLRRGLA